MDTHSPIQISVVIPAYKRRDSVLKLLEDLSHQTFEALEIIVVEDRGDDGTPEAIASRFPNVQCLVNEVNSGPAVSRNRGIRVAKGDIIVGFDSDVAVPDTTLLERVNATFNHHPETAGLAFRLLQRDGKSDDTARWWHPAPIDRYADQMFETSYFSGTAYAFRREPMIAAGLYPEILYMHYEEVELALRLLDSGGQILYSPALTVEHHVSPIANRSRVHKFFKPRNQVLLAIACLPFWHALRYIVPRVIYNIGSALVHHHLHETLTALLSAARLAPRRLTERRPVQKHTLARIAAMSGERRP